MNLPVMAWHKHCIVCNMYCGTSNIELPVKNKSFYPEEFRDASRLTYYASLFNSLEINSTFYKIPRPDTTLKWAQQVPADFRFSVKLWKGITHNKELEFDRSDLEHFFKVIKGFGDNKGCLLVQLPASRKINDARAFQYLLESINELNNGWQIAVEFRDNSWYINKIHTLLEKSGCCLVEHDMPKSITPQKLPQSNTRFIRFHGELGDYRGSYGDEHLIQTAQSIIVSEKENKTVYVYFNNTIGDAVHNAIRLQELYQQLSKTILPVSS